jgi:prepilin-type N-terminal cleavage/methylation domain-containing protein
MRLRRRRQSGFTLLEAMVVMAIIGTIAVVTIPSMRRARMRASMLEVVRTFEQASAVARINAIKRGNNVCLEILPDGSAQQITQFRAWLETVAENEILDGGEEVVGEWQIHRPGEWTFETSSDFPMYVFDSAGGGTARGIVFLPSGMALSSETVRQPGVGRGAFEYYVYQQNKKWNLFRVSVYGGAGTVETMMKAPGGGWDHNFAHWEYY